MVFVYSPQKNLIQINSIHFIQIRFNSHQTLQFNSIQFKEKKCKSQRCENTVKVLKITKYPGVLVYGTIVGAHVGAQWSTRIISSVSLLTVSACHDMNQFTPVDNAQQRSNLSFSSTRMHVRVHESTCVAGACAILLPIVNQLVVPKSRYYWVFRKCHSNSRCKTKQTARSLWKSNGY